MNRGRLKIAILGAGHGGSALLDIFHQSDAVDIVGIVDQNGDAPGLKKAEALGIPTSMNIKHLGKMSPKVVLNVTGHAETADIIRDACSSRVEILEGSGALILWQLIDEREKSLRYLQCVLDDSQDMIITTDKDKNIVKFSKGGERILGYKKDELIGKKVSALYKDADERSRIGQMLEKRGAVYNYETVLQKKDASFADISLTLSNLSDNEGNFIGTVGISKDIGMEKRLRQTLKEKNEELETLNEGLEEKILKRTRELEVSNRELRKANELKGRFIANASHELRTPLNSIIGFSDLLKEKIFGDLNEDQEKYVKNIHTSGNHLLHLVNNILDLAKIEAGKAELDMEGLSITHIIDEVETVLKALSDRKEIELLNEIPKDLNIYADRIKVKQIFYNLISNAIKFTPEGGKVGVRIDEINEGETSEWAPHGHDFIKISVWDTGIGIPHEDLSKIFEEFEQVDTSKSTEGTGLGLSLTKKLIELHGGHIDVASALEEGSVFSLYIPVLSAEEIPLMEEHISYSLSFPPQSADKHESPLILVAEDDMATSEIITIYLTQAGYKVSHAYNGTEAIEKARGEKPFAISLDIMLPKKDGWEVLQALKDDPETSNIPVIIHSIVENRELAFALGATDYLVKPASKDALVNKFNILASEHKKRRKPVTVLALTNNEEFQDILNDMLKNENCIFNFAGDNQIGFEMALSTRPDIVMVDTTMANGGFDIIDRIKSHPMLKHTPVFALTSHEISEDDKHRMTEQIEAVLKKDALESEKLLNHLNSLKIAYPHRAGLVDELTGLFNYRYFEIRYPQEVARAKRYKFPLSMALLHIDHLDNYRNKKGEYYANLTLKKIASLLKKTLRGSDILVRYASDTFGFILTNTPPDAAEGLAGRFVEKIHDYPFLQEDDQPLGRITACMSIAKLEDQDPYEMVESAMAALNKAIEKGGNRVEVV
ncbi:MAG: response regulator [Proteobacteria bacterium]|nr:response regulator [Pseudomonadota bacterium]